MSKFHSTPATPEELYAQAEALLDQTVSRAFMHYRHPPTPEDVARFHGRLSLLLLEDDYRRLRTFDQRAQLSNWPQTVANHEVLHFLKKELKKTSLDDLPPERFVQSPNQEDAVWLHEQQHLMNEAKQRLNEDERELYQLAYVEEWSAKQIAQQLGCSPETVRQRKKRLFEKLKERIDKK
jgi:RNA polymerase sigma factor (sigma-70 family)